MAVAEQWVSVEDVARHLGVARDSVYRWIENQGLPAYKIGRIWKSKLTEVDDWVRAGGADTKDSEKAAGDGRSRSGHLVTAEMSEEK